MHIRTNGHRILIALLLGPLSMAAQDIGNLYPGNPPPPHLRVERAMVFTPSDDWFYAHHASITHFRDRFFAIWSSGRIDEDAPGQRVVYSTSRDFHHWTAPIVLASPSLYHGDTANVLTAAGFHSFKDTLVAYYGEYSPYRTHTHLWARTSADGLHWSAPIDLHLPVNPNHGPELAGDGRLIISGNFTFPYTDDPRGLSGWHMSSFYPDSLYREDNPATFYAPAQKSGLPPLCEGSFFRTNDGVLHMLLRVTGKGWKGLLWSTESRDNGAHWSFPHPTSFTDNDSKFHFGRLPSGDFYYVGIPDTLQHYARTPLVLSLSHEGRYFDRSWIIADEPYTRRREGLWKGGQYGYPHTLVYKGYLYVIVSRVKESIEVIRVKTDQLASASASSR